MAERFAAQVLLAPRADAAADAARAQRAFTAGGFELGPLVGNNFSIEGDEALFEQVFGVTPSRRKDGGVLLRDRTGRKLKQQDLPCSALPEPLRELVTAVVFTQPPAFGPGSLP